MTPQEEQIVTLRSSMRTDVGMVREHNEDSVFSDEELRFFIVADGMGGHAAGEIASSMTVASIRETLSDKRDAIERYAASPTKEHREDVISLLEETVRVAHRDVYETGLREPEKQGMGTTLDALLLAGSEAFIAHVGDSRTYLIRGDNAQPVTMDHTVAEVLVVEGKLTKEEAALSPLRTVLVNAIGVAAEVGVEMTHLSVKKGDRFLICSDGLYDYYPEHEEIFDVIDNNDIDDALSIFVEGAKERGGHDNITAVIVEILDAPEISDEDASVHHSVRDQVSSGDTDAAFRANLADLEKPTLKITMENGKPVLMTDETEDLD